MTRYLLTLITCLCAAPSLLADDLETLRLLEEESARQGGKGVVMELEEEKPGKTRSRARPVDGKQVELIVGGAGEDGIAKRSTLKVED